MLSVKVPKSIVDKATVAPSKRIAAHAAESREASRKAMREYEQRFVENGGARFLLRMDPEVSKMFSEIIEKTGMEKTKTLVALIKKEHAELFGKQK